MKGNMKKIFGNVFCAFVVLLFLAQPMRTMAMEIDSGVSSKQVYDVEMKVNPLYADILGVPELQAEQDESYSSSVNNALDGSSQVHATSDAAAAQLRAAMVDRSTTIDVTVTYALYSANGETKLFDNLFYKAIEYSDACSGQEGDALVGVWRTCRGSVLIDEENSKVTFTYKMTYFSTYAQEQELTATVNEIMSSLNLENDDEYTKVNKIYKYICDNVDYDRESPDEDLTKHTAYAALCKKTSVCQGYALSFYRLCKEAGLSVRYITGTGNEGSHAWDIVRIGEVYYNVDPTWDGQDEESTTKYFLKSMGDFTKQTRSSEFLTKEFVAKFPMASQSWTDYNNMKSKLNGTNYNISAKKLDGTSMSTTASGKPKVLIFFKETNTNEKRTIQALAGTDTSYADIVAMNMNKASVDTVKTYKETYGSDGIVFTYDTSSTTYNYMWKYARMGGYSGGIVLPLIVYIDSDNVVQYVTTGYHGADEIRANVNYYCGTFEPSVGEALKELYVGDTYKITTYACGEKINNAQLKWTTSNADVATVDVNGVVTAVGEGAATITGKLSDKYSVSMSVVAEKKLNMPQFTVENVYGGIEIDWDFVDDATGYIVYRRELNGVFQKIAGFIDGTTKSYVDKNVVKGTTYYYAVKAINATLQSKYTSKGITYKAMLKEPKFVLSNVANGVQINWEFVEDATGYIVYRREEKGTFKKIAGFTDGETKNYVDKNVANGTTYYYAVKAVSSTSQSTYATKEIMCEVKLAVPQFTVANTTEGIQIDWEFVDGATGYIVYRREADGVFQKIAGFTDGETKRYIDKDVMNKTTYFYAVKAINSVTQSTYITKGITSKTMLETPQFTVTNVAEGVQINWEFVDGATEYLVYRQDTSGIFKKIMCFTDGVTTSCVDANVVGGTTYYYAVKAINSESQSTYKTQEITYKVALVAPRFMVENTEEGAQINWEFVDGATGYIVYRREVNGMFQKIAGFTDRVTKSYLDNNVTKGTTYYYAVKAINGTNQSTYDSIQFIP